ncbi:hypothetical protein BDZ91DRAFT_723483 [Kalaharituber pfeilii]|nr:hypothetical protein BDZ91DRAFT_723483 [Kalaharituber pfeilii]
MQVSNTFLSIGLLLHLMPLVGSSPVGSCVAGPSPTSEPQCPEGQKLCMHFLTRHERCCPKNNTCCFGETEVICCDVEAGMECRLHPQFKYGICVPRGT